MTSRLSIQGLLGEQEAVGSLLVAAPDARPDVAAGRILNELIRRGWQPPRPDRVGPLRVNVLHLGQHSDEDPMIYGRSGDNIASWDFPGLPRPALGLPIVAYDPARMLIADGTITELTPRVIMFEIPRASIRQVPFFDFPVPDEEWHRG
ncbi:hypothetical protein [Micromonospora sp. CA-248212]|uniref:hypothetical protein n=1 Tax=Micromonospora sp. CA-248212 TaxID=3239961 RepID=UPI003D8A2865